MCHIDHGLDTMGMCILVSPDCKYCQAEQRAAKSITHAARLAELKVRAEIERLNRGERDDNQHDTHRF